MAYKPQHLTEDRGAAEASFGAGARERRDEPWRLVGCAVIVLCALLVLAAGVAGGLWLGTLGRVR